ncbi:cellulose biosynthesis protein BcsQ [Kerstersia sp.]|uniref:cellulose biosynthesis protein BcsQ n=1 Tax=Kerstersia sp. TaxID=1930783 RepID=UPI003F90B32B
MKTIAIVSAKGGVGKSSLSANLGVALLKTGHPVLLVDLDPQNALGMHLGAPQTSLGIARATLQQEDWSKAVVSTAPGAYLLPYGQASETERMAFEEHIAQTPAWPLADLDRLSLKSDTIVIFDTPPGPSVYLQQVLKSADLAVAVTLSDMASYATLPIMERLVNEYGRSRPEFLGAYYIVNQTDSNRPLLRDVNNVLKSTLQQRLIGQVHQDQAVRDALAKHQDVLGFAPYSQAAHDIQACATRIGNLLFGDRKQ